VSSGRREGTNVEYLIQGLLHPQWVLVGKGVRLAPLPIKRVVAIHRPEVRDAFMPGEFDDVGAGFFGGRGAVVPPW